MAFHNVPPNGFPDLPDMEEVEAVVKDVTNLKTSVAELESGLIGEIVAIGTGATVYRQGAMRILKLYGAESTSTGVISELTASDRPLVQVLNPCVYNDGTTKNGYIIIEATGEIKLLDVDTDTAVSGGRAFSVISYYIL